MTLAPQDLQKLQTFTLLLAEEAGQILRQFWGNINAVSQKEGAGNLVTEADQACESRLISLISEHYPQHAILAEESGNHSAKNSEFLWVIDPLDGTTNYAHQYPMVAVSIALIYKKNPVIGLVHNPILEELFWAVKGEGAFLNSSKMHVSLTETLQKSLLASGFAYDRCETTDNNYREFCHLTSLTQGVRRGGSAALDLAYVAAGRFDGYWERGIKPWDIAAGILLVEEAGGEVSAYDGNPWNLYEGKILATNRRIHHALSSELLMLKNQ